ncbi:MAG: SUMF1/EgtB/PvdO family nonheme iron enzyme [Caldilineaceae bacterium]
MSEAIPTPMRTILYHNFDLAIDPSATAPQHYRARVLDSGAGQASAEFVLPFSDLEVENFLLRINRPRRGVRRIDSPEMLAARQFGSRLFEAVFSGSVQTALLRSLDEATRQRVGLRLRLRLTDAPALADLPWEYLYVPSLNRFFVHSLNTPLVRYLDLPQTSTPLAVQPPLNVLVMIANPRDQAKLDVEAEWRKVQEALADLTDAGLVTVTRLEQATLSALQRRLRKEEYHIFHFVGHGGFDRQTDNGVLLLEDEKGLSRLVGGHYLGTLLHDHPTLRLALLNSCEGARTARSDPFGGVAQHLVQQGIPAVLAMQFEITDEAAITLAHEFYAALADQYPVDAALAEARKAIFTQGNDIEWGTPVLYLRAPDGQLFDWAAVAAQPAPVVEPAPMPPPERKAPPIVTTTPPPVKPAPPAEPAAGATSQIEGITFVYVPAGEFTMGSDNGSDDEKPAHKVNLPGFWIMKTPVTNAQYRAFVAAGDYEQKTYWTAAGWQWRTKEQITQPRYWDDKQWNGADYPVVGVSWYEASAYTRWLATTTKLTIALPTEAQWEKAARGTDGRIYPWGNNAPNDQLLNYNNYVKHTTAVGRYPQGVSPYGCLDMAGNVWEWTSSLQQPYPYKADDGRENSDSANHRVVRGGDFDDLAVRCAVRYGNFPDFRGGYLDVGFRLVLSPSALTSGRSVL